MAARSRYIRVIPAVEFIASNLRWAERLLVDLLAGGPAQVSIGRPKRNELQNAKFHAMCSDVARQSEFMGRKLTPHQWKVLFISGHSIVTGQGADMVPGIEGEFVNIRERSSTMTVKRMASLIEYVSAYCAENDIKLREPEDRYQ